MNLHGRVDLHRVDQRRAAGIPRRSETEVVDGLVLHGHGVDAIDGAGHEVRRLVGAVPKFAVHGDVELPRLVDHELREVEVGEELVSAFEVVPREPHLPVGEVRRRERRLQHCRRRLEFVLLEVVDSEVGGYRLPPRMSRRRLPDAIVLVLWISVEQNSVGFCNKIHI